MKKIIQLLLGHKNQKKIYLETPQKNVENLPENVESYLSELYKKKENELLSSKGNMLRVVNKKHINKLTLNDKIEQDRKVFHYLYFKNNIEKTNFLLEVSTYGFQFVNEIRRKKGEYPVCIEIMRIDKVDIKSINEYAFFLHGLALNHNGIYDSWEIRCQEEDE